MEALPPPPSPAPAQVALAARVDAAGPAEALRLIDPHTDDPALGARRGRALLQLGRHDEAADTYWRVLKAHRDVADPYLGLAWTYLDQGQFGMAHQPLEQGLAIAPGYEPGWRELGRSYYWLKRYGKAVDALDHALKLDRKDPQAWLYKGLSLGMDHHLSQAVTALTEAAALDPAGALPRRMRGRYLLELKHPAEAEVALKAAYKLDPTDEETRQLLLKALWAQGKQWEALGLWWNR
ncbi:MAG: Tetratricopeptide 1 repeat-containing protein [Cyanobacteria bacterium RYN_339]|nr:Tetratricopeptide 1 repeat-containing protein [Cyanobacteria bacterium RYN_339]